MPSAKQVRQKKFILKCILCEDHDFTVAWGILNIEPEAPERLAMRWNGKSNEHGFPHQGKSPTWFMLPEELSIPLLKALLGTKSAKNQCILEVLKQLHPTAH